MKNQYFADVNDYRKYGLLRVIARSSGLRLGVCWMLTEPDTRSDGQFVRYWKQPERWRKHDPTLFDALSRCGYDPTLRHVDSAAEWQVLPGAIYYTPLLFDSAAERRMYFRQAWDALADCELLFFDPDNGLEVPSVPYGARNSSKYLYWSEVDLAFGRGHSLLIYQHFQRKSRTGFTRELASQLEERTGAGAVYSFTTSHVVFLLALQPAHVDRLTETVVDLIAHWRTQVEPLRHVTT